MINQPAKQFREFVSKISTIENQHMEALRNNKRELVERHSAGVLNMGEETVVREIYRNKNAEAGNGKDADKLYRKIKENSKNN